MRSLSPTSQDPFATAMSVVVKVSPPKTRPSLTRRWPTDCGPIDIPLSRTKLPPPSPIVNISGMRKFVRTPPTFIWLLLSRGNPSARTPTSEVVPPMSTTIALSIPDRIAAPRKLFVGPLEKVNAG